jgi:hypothetical protein
VVAPAGDAGRLEGRPAQAPVEGVEVLVAREVDEQPSTPAQALEGDGEAQSLLESAPELLVVGG